MNPKRVRVAFSKPDCATRAEIGPLGANCGSFTAKPSSCHVHSSQWVTPTTSPCTVWCNQKCTIGFKGLIKGMHRLKVLWSRIYIIIKEQEYFIFTYSAAMCLIQIKNGTTKRFEQMPTLRDGSPLHYSKSLLSALSLPWIYGSKWWNEKSVFAVYCHFTIPVTNSCTNSCTNKWNTFIAFVCQLQSQSTTAV